jgi:transcriptional regulator with XRE-family HTH domain
MYPNNRKEEVFVGRGSPVGSNMTACTTPFGTFIRKRRIELKLSQKTVGQNIPRSGRPHIFISELEIGTKKQITLDQAKALAKVLKLDIEAICKFGVIHIPPQPTQDVRKIIQDRREELGMSRKELAQQLGISVDAARTMELAQKPTIAHQQARKLARVLQMDVSSFVPFLVRSSQKASSSKLGTYIRKAREARVWSMLTLAEQVGVSRQWISLVELGKWSVSKDNPTLQKIIAVLELERDLVVSFIDPPKKPGRKRIHPPRIPARYLDMVKLGAFIRAQRKSRGLTQGELADKTQLSYESISRIEGGAGKRAPHKGTILALEAALGCTINLEDFERK